VQGGHLRWIGLGTGAHALKGGLRGIVAANQPRAWRTLRTSFIEG
jgi:hypothetical protein